MKRRARPSLSPEAKKRVLRRLGIFISASSVGLVLLVLVFVIRNEHAHDETRCPFRLAERRPVAGAESFVIDEKRECIEGLEEHRWTVERGGVRVREIGRRRLATRFFTPQAYSFVATETERGVLIVVENAGAKSMRYSERP